MQTADKLLVSSWLELGLISRSGASQTAAELVSLAPRSAKLGAETCKGMGLSDFPG